ncbi:Holliday junction resolvase [Candidatus Woesearchaeota archaeon]|nr:Holliday junction resolvase [Candidatus Woesearchaeota archaeon]
MNRKAKGIAAERAVVHMFWKTGTWAAIRVAGSGAIKYPVPDVLAANTLRRLAIECKATKQASEYIPKAQVNDLRKFCRLFGAEGWIAVKFNNRGFAFISLEDLDETLESFVVSRELVERKGLSFEQLVG